MRFRAFRARSLFARVFLHGLLILVASAATFLGLGLLLLGPEVDRRMLEFGRWMAPHVCAELLAQRRSPLPRHSVATLYDARGSVIASATQPPLPPLPLERVAELRESDGIVLPGARPLHAFWCGGAGEGTYVQMGPPPAQFSAALLMPAAMAVLVVGLASVPFARSIARPLAKLVGVTQAFGRGDLGVRIDLPRSDEVGELAVAFNRMAARLQRVILAEQELLANVSHELRTPLARMRVVLETAEEDPRRAEAMLREIGRDLHDLERLVESVTETMRLGMASNAAAPHQLPAQREPVDLGVCLRRALERFRALHPDRAVQLAAPDGALPVHADARLIQRLLANLLDNARKYSADATPIALRAFRDTKSTRVLVEVVDHGIGIDAAELPHVLDPFFRGEQGRAAVPGAGLGLALVKRIVDLHDGELVIHSQAGVGTTVRIALSEISDAPSA